MHARMRARARTHTHTHTHTLTYIHTYILTYKHTNAHAYKHTSMHACIHTYIHTYIHAYTHTHTSRYNYVHILQVNNIHRYTMHTYMHTYTHRALLHSDQAISVYLLYLPIYLSVCRFAKKPSFPRPFTMRTDWRTDTYISSQTRAHLHLHPHETLLYTRSGPQQGADPCLTAVNAPMIFTR